MTANTTENAANTFPNECVASGQSCEFGMHGPRGEWQCRYCGHPPELTEQKRTHFRKLSLAGSLGAIDFAAIERRLMAQQAELNKAFEYAGSSIGTIAGRMRSNMPQMSARPKSGGPVGKRGPDLVWFDEAAAVGRYVLNLLEDDGAIGAPRTAPAPAPPAAPDEWTPGLYATTIPDGPLLLLDVKAPEAGMSCASCGWPATRVLSRRDEHGGPRAFCNICGPGGAGGTLKYKRIDADLSTYAHLGNSYTTPARWTLAALPAGSFAGLPLWGCADPYTRPTVRKPTRRQGVTFTLADGEPLPPGHYTATIGAVELIGGTHYEVTLHRVKPQ